MSFRVEPGWLRSQRVVGRENIHAPVSSNCTEFARYGWLENWWIPKGDALWRRVWADVRPRKILAARRANGEAAKFFWPPLGWPTTAQWMSGGLRGAERAERGDNFLKPRVKLDGFG